ncbi:hypothetical protein FB45DRAFT_911309 [Roridomyces roridus]|uniref:SnoaL-like domain-containing protein n=1 Tax=Roridomyces roridus TaxID=1738132 RepID=A0AAD7C0F4_9AGAR|nr:hypothetical protein FB45DRAFT_911309 [Roridomyces roridus]
MKLLPPLDVVQGEDVVVFHLKSEGTAKSGKSFNNEYIFTFRFEGERILSIREFVDSGYAAEWFAGAGEEV